MTSCSVSGFAVACPVLCSGNGQYSKGTCQCYSGWKGAECDVPMNQCIDPSCGGHGSCIDGNCVCSAGYKGEHCEEGKLLALLGRAAEVGCVGGPGSLLEPSPNFKHLGFDKAFLSPRKQKAVEWVWKECFSFVYSNLHLFPFAIVFSVNCFLCLCLSLFSFPLSFLLSSLLLLFFFFFLPLSLSSFLFPSALCQVL